MIHARKIYKIPEFYMIFARKMPEFYIKSARKIFSPNFRGARAPPAPLPVSYAHDWPIYNRGSAVYEYVSFTRLQLLLRIRIDKND